jgi:uncharacterized protein (TIRG00374 family)
MWIKVALSYTLAIACLAWVFHDYDFSDLPGRVARMNLLLVAIAIIFDFLSFVGQGLRSQLLLRPFGSISVLRATQAIYSGLFVNEVLPLKLGELLRAYLISRWTSVKLGTVASSILIERFCDGFWLVAAFVVTMIFVSLPRRLIEAGDALGILVFILLGLLIGLAWWTMSAHFADEGVHVSDGHQYSQRASESAKKKRNQVSWSLTRSLGGSLYRFAVGLRVMLYSRSCLFAFCLSLLLVSLQWIALWLVTVAFGLRLTLLEVAAVFMIVRVGTSVPGAPANIGSYQFFTVLGLTLFGTDKTSAAGFSLVVFVLLSTHIWILGFWSLRRSGLTLSGMRTQLSKSLPENDCRIDSSIAIQ